MIEDDYYHHSCIYIKNSNHNEIVVVGNTFDSNVGLFGGAIMIDNHDDWQKNQDEKSEINDVQSAAILIYNNSFTRNMAYFDGNAIYLIGGQTNKTVKYNDKDTYISKKALMHATIEKNLFEKNHGMTTSLGAAVSINGRQS